MASRNYRGGREGFNKRVCERHRHFVVSVLAEGEPSEGSVKKKGKKRKEKPREKPWTKKK